jgi:predicted O-methyltransferase YrrM
LKNNQIITIIDLGAGSKKSKTNKKKISDIAKFSLSSPKYCRLFYRLVEFCNSKNILELGTSLGITTLYLDNQKTNPKITTIEGDTTIFNLAKNIFEENEVKINILNLDFDSFFCKIANENHKFDLIFIDGNHTKEATLRYFNLAKKNISEKGVIVFDDIRWSKGMLEAWEIIKNSEFSGVVIDIFKIGIVIFDSNFIEKQYLTHYY